VNKIIVQATKICVILTLAAVMAAVFLGKSNYILGVVSGSLWMGVNIYFTAKILSIATLKEDRSKLWVSIMVKFPLLYLVLLFILVSKDISKAGVLIGITMPIVSAFVSKMTFKPL